jgi:hypothetical protein
LEGHNELCEEEDEEESVIVRSGTKVRRGEERKNRM